MVNPDVQGRIKAVKVKIEKLIADGCLDEAKSALDQYNAKMPGDPDICSMRAVVAIMEGSLGKAEAFIEDGLKKDSVQFDLVYNLAYVRELQGLNQDAADLYKKACSVAVSDDQISNVDMSLERLKTIDADLMVTDKSKIVFFVKEGMDSFLGDIISGLSNNYWVRKIIVGEFGQIDEGMAWADICWFEWCDELVIYGSKLMLANERRIICRLHSYEAFTDYPTRVIWKSVDKIVFVAEHIRKLVSEQVSEIEPEKTIVIPNGIDLARFRCKKRAPGHNIAYLGYINYKKGPMLLLQVFKAIFDWDNNYKLYIAGEFQDQRDILYFRQMLKELGIDSNVYYEGWQDNVSEWLSDKNYIISTSLLEANPVGIMEAMSMGIKPVIHNFVGAKNQYPAEYIWNTPQEAIEIITSGNYDSEEYHNYIKSKFSLAEQLNKSKYLIIELLSKKTIVEETMEFLSGPYTNRVKIDDLSVFFPSYDRAEIVRDDFLKGYKMPGQPKIIVDDFSDDINREILYKLKAESNDIENIIFHNKNMGVAAAFSTGIKNADSKFVLICGDDDILFWRTISDINEEVRKIGEEYVFVIPRYILNLADDGSLRIGYDRLEFDGMPTLEVLKHIFLSGELNAMVAGMIAKTDDLQKCTPDNIFRVAEDYVTAARLLAMYPKLSVRIIDSLVYVRRVSNNTLSRKINDSKLSIHLLSLVVSGYYCVKNGTINRKEMIGSLKKRSQLLKSIYNYNIGFADIITEYISNKISLSEFLSYMNSFGINVNPDNLPEEVKYFTKI